MVSGLSKPTTFASMRPIDIGVWMIHLSAAVPEW